MSRTGAIGLTANGTVLETKFATAGWNATVRPAELKTAAPAPINAVNAATLDTAALAFPSDYDSSSSSLNRVYVALGDSTGATSLYDVWRINGSINSTGTVIAATNLKSIDGGASGNNTSIAYTGTAASGTLVVGEVGGGVSFATTPNGTRGLEPGYESPDWNESQYSLPEGFYHSLCLIPERCRFWFSYCYQHRLQQL